MNVPFLVYDSEGRIRRSGWVPEGAVALQPQEGEAVLQQSGDSEAHYVNLNGAWPVLAVRPDTTVTASENGSVVTVSGLQIGTVVHVTGDADTQIEFDDPDGSLELTIETPGSYTIFCEQFPQKKFSTVVTL